MHRTNQILLQLCEADKFACAKNPHLRRFAVILLDNMIELQLFRKSEFAFMVDQTTWYKGVRKHDRKRRHAVSRNHAELILFAREKDWISEGDLSLLRYAHKIRNEFYHEGTYDALDAELSIRLLYLFIDAHFPKWKSASMLTQLSPEDPTPIDEATKDKTGLSPLMLGCDGESDDVFSHSRLIKSEDYWKQAIAKVLTYRPSQSICELIQEKATSFLETIQGRIDFILENHDIDLCDVLIHRFAIFTDAFVDALIAGKSMTIQAAVNIYLAVAKDHERLLDIEDQTERTDEYHKVLNAHSFVADPIPQQMIDGFRERVDALGSSSEAEGIALFLQIEKELRIPSKALEELAFDLDGYIQQQIDIMRGK